MSYLTISLMVRDSALIERITACAATLGVENPDSAVRPHMWEYVTTPGWVDAYKGAGSNPGANETAITDQMIRDAVTASITEGETP